MNASDHLVGAVAPTAIPPKAPEGKRPYLPNPIS